MQLILRAKYNEIETAFLAKDRLKVTLTDNFTFTFIMKQNYIRVLTELRVDTVI